MSSEPSARVFEIDSLPTRDEACLDLTELIFVSTDGRLHLSEYMAHTDRLRDATSPYEVEQYIFEVLSKP